ncbi:Uma2 family endonuclease [Nocardiopsis metallicus]|uniref:Uma2 family endonuclease n=1 Tax=Nocardiopsis metallicus TaxID=179819 RepID=A0A840W7A2_9ACTN|nr:Uma2 family endonuclease [Nocardiopsis metallicus]MBB5492880.1 Uma2 family endonuclease [Nocardiopsis metallicus]
MATVGDEHDPTTGGSDVSAPTVPEKSVSSRADQWSLIQPPPEGCTADDLDRRPDLPPHTELIDGSLVLVSPQKLFPMLVLKLLERELDRQVPEHLLVAREFSVKLAKRQRPEPDLLLVRTDALDEFDQTWVLPSAVQLAVEVVSPESEIRDRERKPELYARAGIPHFWRVEQDGDEAVAYVHGLDPASGRYGRPSIHRGVLKTTVPVDTEIDLAGLRGR